MDPRGLYIFAMLATGGLVPLEDGTYRLPYADGYDDIVLCPWPFDPWQLYGQPLGQYHCPYCGSMVLAGMPHPDYSEEAMDGHLLGVFH